MQSPARLCCALVVSLLSLSSGCRKATAQEPELAPTVTVPAPADPAPSDPAPPPVEPPASREDALACEALVDLRTLMEEQRAFHAERDHYAADATLLSALPACADGTRAPSPDATWLSGCHFRYRVTDASVTPDGTFTLQAAGTGAAEGRAYTVTSGTLDSQRVWPAELTLDVCGERLAPSVCEAALNLRALYVAQQATTAEKGRYSEVFTELGFSPEPCLDGTRADGLAPPGAGCHFHYEVEVQGTAPEQTFVAKARGAGALEGTTLQYTSSSTWGPADVDVRPCFDTGEPTACEAAAHLRNLFTAQKAHFQEKDRYSEDLVVIGFEAPPCIDGTRLQGGAPPAAGCHFTYRVEVQGTAPEQTFTAIARDAQGGELRYDSSATWTPAEPACRR